MTLRRLRLTDPENLSDRITALAKRSKGEVTLSQVVAELGLPDEAVLKAFDLLESKGQCHRERRDEREFYIFPGLQEQKMSEVPVLWARVQRQAGRLQVPALRRRFAAAEGVMRAGMGAGARWGESSAGRRRTRAGAALPRLSPKGGEEEKQPPTLTLCYHTSESRT